MAGVKITDLEVLTEAASDDLLYIVDVSDNTSGPQGTSKQIEVGNVARPYKVYTALLTQSGTAAPTAVVLENSIGNIVWTRQAAGEYTATLSSAFVLNKTLCLVYANSPDVEGTVAQIRFERTDISNLILQSGSTASGFTDTVMLNLPIEIRVYN
jgi:hypothetical protein